MLHLVFQAWFPLFDVPRGGPVVPLFEESLKI
jgi:hypothetical protein